MKVMVVLSGGLDSAVAAAKIRSDYPEVELLGVNFLYGSRHGKVERHCARKLAHHFGFLQSLIEIDLPRIEKSWLTQDAQVADMPKGVPVSYVPARNLIFISYAASLAIINECTTAVLGIHETDAPYPDCTGVFLDSMRDAVLKGTAGKVILHSPLLHMSKAQIVELGHELEVPFRDTWTCYDPQFAAPDTTSYWCPELNAAACGRCLACTTRIEAFKKNDLFDPILYAVDIDWEDNMKAFCNNCGKTTTQHSEDNGRLRVCDKCGRKVIVK